MVATYSTFTITRTAALALRNGTAISARRTLTADSGDLPDNRDREEFRVLLDDKKSSLRTAKKRRDACAPPRYKSMSPEQDWTDVWPAVHTFKYSAVPLPIRQGLVTCMEENEGIVPGKYGNAELMKIPNFLHLTPAHVKKHCEAIKSLCTEFPKELTSEEVCEKDFPVAITTRDYVQSSLDIRDERARVVILEVNLDSLKLDEVSRDKLRRLASPDEYCEKTNMLKITADRCPRRSQNRDYAYYLLAALYLEAQTRESWEAEKTYADQERYFWETSPAKKKLDKLSELMGKKSEELERSYEKAVVKLHDEKKETKEDLEEYRRVVEALYGLGS